jgi:murein DD-endopeptidase MepM/ murein hydrolase activator NlpD
MKLPCKDNGGYRTFGKVYDGLLHLGHDINNNIGTDVHAIADGTVIGCYFVDGYGSLNPSSKGWTIMIHHVINGQDFVYQYGHVIPLIKDGEKVYEDQIIGNIASFTNNGEQLPHLHFGKHIGKDLPQGYWGYSRDNTLNGWVNPLE